MDVLEIKRELDRIQGRLERMKIEAEEIKLQCDLCFSIIAPLKDKLSEESA